MVQIMSFQAEQVPEFNKWNFGQRLGHNICHLISGGDVFDFYEPRGNAFTLMVVPYIDVLGPSVHRGA